MDKKPQVLRKMKLTQLYINKAEDKRSQWKIVLFRKYLKVSKKSAG